MNEMDAVYKWWLYDAQVGETRRVGEVVRCADAWQSHFTGSVERMYGRLDGSSYFKELSRVDRSSILLYIIILFYFILLLC
jgi:hypothetical protein